MTTTTFPTQTTFKLGDRAYTLDGCSVCKRRKGVVYVGKVVQVDGDVVAVRLRRTKVYTAQEIVESKQEAERLFCLLHEKKGTPA